MSDMWDSVFDILNNRVNQENQRANAADFSRSVGEDDLDIDDWERKNLESARVFREQHRMSIAPIDRYIERERQNGR